MIKYVSRIPNTNPTTSNTYFLFFKIIGRIGNFIHYHQYILFQRSRNRRFHNSAYFFSSFIKDYSRHIAYIFPAFFSIKTLFTFIYRINQKSSFGKFSLIQNPHQAWKFTFGVITPCSHENFDTMLLQFGPHVFYHISFHLIRIVFQTIPLGKWRIFKSVSINTSKEHFLSGTIFYDTIKNIWSLTTYQKHRDQNPTK